MKKLVLSSLLALTAVSIGIMAPLLGSVDKWWVLQILLGFGFFALGRLRQDLGAIGLVVLAANNLVKTIGLFATMTALDIAAPAYLLGLTSRQLGNFRDHAEDTDSPPRTWWPTWAFLLLCLSSIMSVFLSGDKTLALLSIKRTLVYMVVGYGVYVGIRTQSGFRWLVYAVSIQVAWISINGLLTSGLSADSVMSMGQFVLVDSGARTDVHFGNPASLGQYLMMSLPWVIAQIYEERRSSVRITLLVVTGVGIGCLLLTLSRGAWVGMIISTTFVLMVTWRSRQAKFSLVGSLALCALAVSFTPAGAVIQRLVDTINPQEVSNATRIEIYQYVVGLLSERPITGFGAGFTFGTLPFSPVHQTYAHNTYLQVWLEQGLMGVTAFVGILAGLLISGLRYLRHTSINLRSPIAWHIGFLVGTMVHFLIDYTFYSDRTYPVFWALIGLYGARIRGLVWR